MTNTKSLTTSTDSKKIRELAKLLDETNLSEIEIETDGARIRVARQFTTSATLASVAPVASGAPAPSPPSSPSADGGAPSAQSADGGAAADAAENADNPNALISPMVGTAYLSPEPGEALFCKVGDQVSEGQTMFIVEAMKTMNPITAHKSGKVSKICIANAQSIEFGEALAIIE